MNYKLIKRYPGYNNVGRITWFGPNNLVHPENYPEFWELVVEKDYEILEVKGKYGAISSYIEKLDNDLKDKTIFKIKRLSDSEIFTIGDKVVGYNNSIAKIKTIDLVGEISLNIGTDKSEGFSLKNLKKVKQPLFTTEDGIDIFAGMSFYYVCEELELYNTICCTDEKKYKNAKQFSTKEKAEEYILLNKPCLSYGDVQEYLKVKDCNKVLDLAQSKIQQSV